MQSPVSCAMQSPSPACPLCSSKSRFYGEVDFNKSCLEAQGKEVARSGVMVKYHRCDECGFLFSSSFDDWRPDDFKKYIYNKDYILIDPDYVDVRPKVNAQDIDNLFHLHKKLLRFLDYGGGNGVFAASLREKGYRAETFDPFSEHAIPTDVKAHIVTAYEVIEHSVQQAKVLDDLLSFLDDQGVVLFSTLLQPDDFDKIGLSWWYVAPRNGHVSIHSSQSLDLLFHSRGMTVFSINEDTHFAYRDKSSPLATYLIEVGQNMRKDKL